MGEKEIDIGDLLEQDNVEYERKNAKNIRISVLPEPSAEDKIEGQKKTDQWLRKAQESKKQIEEEIARGKSNFGKIMISDSLRKLLEQS
jgi:hypothetical protein